MPISTGIVDMSFPLSGMARAESRLEVSASRIARAPLSAATRADTVDLSAEMIALMTSRNDFEANVKVAQTFDEVNQSLLDLLG
jgi:long-subunit fatty acid transport protein